MADLHSQIPLEIDDGSQVLAHGLRSGNEEPGPREDRRSADVVREGFEGAKAIESHRSRQGMGVVAANVCAGLSGRARAER